MANLTPKTYKKFPGLLFYDCDQNSEEWYQERSLSVGSSEASASFAGGSGATRAALMERKILEQSGIEVESFCSLSMDRGSRLEEQAVLWFEQATGLQTIEVGIVRNREYPGYHSSPDRLILIGNRLVPFEAKCPRAKAQKKYMKEWALPTEYIKQMNTHQIICNSMYGFFLSWHPALGAMLLKVPAPSRIERIKHETSMARWNRDFAEKLLNKEKVIEEYHSRKKRLESEEAELVESARIRTEELLEKIHE